MQTAASSNALALAALGYRLRTLIASSERLYFPLYRLLRTRRHGLVDATTAVTIEGFPRSGNSFAQRAFALANPGVAIAHHTHAAAQVAASVRRGLPTLVLIREPGAAIRSLLVQRPAIGAAAAAASYLSFYRPLVRLRSGFVLAAFEQATRDMGAVTHRLNQRFATAFTPFEHSPENVATVFRQMDEHHAQRYGSVRASHLARPLDDREARKAAVNLPDLPALREAHALYRALLADTPAGGITGVR